jgi:hypothetical protein
LSAGNIHGYRFILGGSVRRFDALVKLNNMGEGRAQPRAAYLLRRSRLCKFVNQLADLRRGCFDALETLANWRLIRTPIRNAIAQQFHLVANGRQ